MEWNWVHSVSMRIIMLEKSLRATIEYFDFIIWSAWCQARAIWVESDSRDHASMILERMNDLLSRQIPQFDSAIVTTWGDHSRVKGELRAPYPILMPSQCLSEFKFIYVPHLHELIVRCWDEEGSISVEIDALYRCSVTLHHCTLCTCIVVPHSNWGVPRAWSNVIALWIDRNITNRASVSYEFVWSCIWSQTPCLYEAIIWTGDYLLETWVKDRHCDGILMALKSLE